MDNIRLLNFDSGVGGCGARMRSYNIYYYRDFYHHPCLFKVSYDASSTRIAALIVTQNLTTKKHSYPHAVMFRIPRLLSNQEVFQS